MDSTTNKIGAADNAAHGSATIKVPHYINEDNSDIRGIKHGWYAIDNAGKLSSGPFSSHEDCLNRGTQPTNELTQSESRPRLK